MKMQFAVNTIIYLLHSVYTNSFALFVYFLSNFW